MIYTKYLYLYPPRPEQTTDFTNLVKYDNGTFCAFPKYNGTCSLVFLNGKDKPIFMNRHNEPITSGNYSNIDLAGLHSGNGWMVLCGEFLNKNKKGEDGNPFNLKFVIWDILVYEGNYMLGSNIMERFGLLYKLFPAHFMEVDGNGKLITYKHVMKTAHNNVYITPLYESGFEVLYNDIVDTDLYEGLVLKRKDGLLTIGLNEVNNNRWQIKCRKKTKNYQF